jgi:hypothetical protein
MSFGDWVKGTYQNCDDPTEWNGKNPKCKLCDEDVDFGTEHCYDHKRCIFCGDHECECKEESSQVSYCCGAKWDSDTMRCYHCKEWTENAWDGEMNYQENKK